MDWDQYATTYDRLCEQNPAYQENIDSMVGLIRSSDLGSAPRICDVGAGTGNFITAASALMPDAQFTHLDCNASMNRIASEKYERNGISNVEIVEEFVQRASFRDHSFDLIICVHALYAMPPQTVILRKLRRWLTPNGLLFVIDIGRKHRVFDWGLYIYKNLIARYGYIRATARLLTYYTATRENLKTAKGQEHGDYWLHTTPEFKETLEKAGLSVLAIDPCYRGASDRAICAPAIDGSEALTT